MTLDLEKMAQLNPNNPSAAAAMKSMFGGETMSSWLGTDGKQVFHVMAPAWDDVVESLASPGAIGRIAEYAGEVVGFPGARLDSMLSFYSDAPTLLGFHSRWMAQG